MSLTAGRWERMSATRRRILIRSGRLLPTMARRRWAESLRFPAIRRRTLAVSLRAPVSLPWARLTETRGRLWAARGGWRGGCLVHPRAGQVYASRRRL